MLLWRDYRLYIIIYDVFEYAADCLGGKKNTECMDTATYKDQLEQEIIMIDITLLQDFIDESEEHLDEMEVGLLSLEDAPDDKEKLNDVFRSVHSIKGSAEYIGAENIARLTHKLENLLELLRQGDGEPDRALIDLLIDSRDRLSILLKDLSRDKEEKTDISDILKQIEILSGRGGQQPEAATGEDDSPTADYRSENEACLPEDDDGIVELTDIIDDADFETEDEIIELTCIVEEPAAYNKIENQDKDEIPDKNECASALLAGEAEAHDFLLENQEDAPPVEGKIAYDDESDEELMEIFLQHLQENLLAFRELVKGLPMSGNCSDIFVKCLNIVLSLKSSANYMDFKELVDVYEEWISQIEKFQEELFLQDQVDFSVFFKSVKEYTTKITGFFPKHPEIGIEIDIEAVDEQSCEQPGFKSSEASSEIDDVDLSLNPEQASREKDTDLFEAAIVERMNLPADYNPMEDFQQASTPLAERSRSSESINAASGKIKKSKNSLELELSGDKTLSHQKRFAPKKSDSPAGKILAQSVRVDVSKIDGLMNRAGELVINRAAFTQLLNEMNLLKHDLYNQSGLDQTIGKRFQDLTFRFGETISSLGRVANDLQEDAMKIRMFPIAQLFNRYPRLIRDLTRGTEKKVRLIMSGEDTELDKMIIQEIGDPLVHIIRNAVDHGIETVAERRKAGKADEGLLQLKSFHEGNCVVIEIIDDGMGIDPEIIKEVAARNNIMTQPELDRMQTRELIRLIMKPGFSTSSEITKTSGRGVGMDVVRQNIEKLNGAIEISSKPGTGTCILIKIPLTMAIIKALMVTVAGDIFTIPLASVEETFQMEPGEFFEIEGMEVIRLRGNITPLLRLSELFRLETASRPDAKVFVVIVNTGERKVGLIVDELLGQQEVVIKPLMDYLQEDSGFSGATILGDGSISFIIDVHGLIKLAGNIRNRRRKDSNYYMGTVSRFCGRTISDSAEQATH